MPDYSWIPTFLKVAVVVLGLGAILAVLWSIAQKSKRFRQTLRESFFKTVGAPYRNSIALLLGATAALLPLTSQTWSIATATWVFVSGVGLIMLLLVAVRPNSKRKSYLFAWGLSVVIVLGFGLGALIYQARPWWIAIWKQYALIDTTPEFLLQAMFLLGVILGVFVVRNWGKEDKAFMESLAGILGGTFVATVLGNVQPGFTSVDAIAYYALGFAMSAAFNLLLAAALTANYTNKQSRASRAVLDFLYGTERAKLIDSSFLRNFEADPDYAKALLRAALVEYCKLVKRELAKAMGRRITQRSDKHFYELVAIECGDKTESPPDAIESPLLETDRDREYNVIYRPLAPNSRISPIDCNSPTVDENMFRVGIAMRRQDVLDYIVTPGEYRGSFPYIGSVAGLSLIVRKTIIMTRDRNKKFRSKDYREGICPRDIEQWRGLDEIDFLSYISVPVVAHLGQANELALGVVNIDSKIFVTEFDLEGEPVPGSDMFCKRLTPNTLNEYASRLYDPEDEDVKHIEKLTKIVEPVLELYAKCRVGAP